jgi:hypothetical protein
MKVLKPPRVRVYLPATVPRVIPPVDVVVLKGNNQTNIEMWVIMTYVVKSQIRRRVETRAIDRGRIGVFYGFKMPKTHWR